MAAWLFLALFFTSTKAWVATIVAGAVFFVGCVATVVGVRRIGPQHEGEERVLESLDLEPTTLDKLQQKLLIEPRALEKTVRRLLRQGTIHENDGQLELAETVASRTESSRYARDSE
jgi:hypothetical protein